MKKEAQKVVNALCEDAVNKSIEYMRDLWMMPESVERLKTCQAWILHYEKYDILKSYETYVALYDKETDTFYDVLRYSYGYTATSAQHIAKFYNKVCKESHCQPSLLRYYDI